jgi:hypothetical protein
MIWILAFLCLGISALVGFAQGPIRGIFALVGLFFATVLAGPIGSLIKPLVAAVGYRHPVYLHSIPAGIAFVVVWAVFVGIGAGVHRRCMVFHKYDEDDTRYYRWLRVYQRLGLCLGLFCGAVLFFVLLLPIYAAGYFTTEFDPGSEASFTVRTINGIRADMHSLKLDRVLAAYDPLPNNLYDASDLLAILLGNRHLVDRLARYPDFVALAETPEYRDLATNAEFARMFGDVHSRPLDLLAHPKVQAIATNAMLCERLFELVSEDHADLKDYLLTGKSAKYDNEKLLGYWVINPRATSIEERKKLSSVSATQIWTAKVNAVRQVSQLSLTITTSKEAILRRGESILKSPVLIRGTWDKKGSGDETGSAYTISLAGSKPDVMDATVKDDQLVFTKDGVTMVFDRDM